MKKLAQIRRRQLEAIACEQFSDEQLLCIDHFKGQVSFKLNVQDCVTDNHSRTKSQNESFVTGFRYRFTTHSDWEYAFRGDWWQQGWKYADQLIKATLDE